LFHRISAEEMMAMGTTDSNSGSPIAEKLSETCRQEAKAVLSEIKLFAVN